jgi:hypothetical protein
MNDSKLFQLKFALKHIRTQCWIDQYGKCHWLDIEKFCKKYKTDISSIVSVHGIILDQIDEGL